MGVDRYQYLILMGLCVAITLPLEVRFGARVWRRPRRLLGALAPAMAVFVVWDLWATASGTWGFNDRYTVGVDLPGGMAVEELVFFTVIPVCGLLTLETVRRILRIWDAADGSGRVRLVTTARRALRGGTDGPTGPGPQRSSGAAGRASAATGRGA